MVVGMASYDPPPFPPSPPPAPVPQPDSAMTALLVACKNGHERLVSILLNRHANVMAVDVRGRVCVHARRPQSWSPKLHTLVCAVREFAVCMLCSPV
jgi:hypothetical protein